VGATFHQGPGQDVGHQNRRVTFKILRPFTCDSRSGSSRRSAQVRVRLVMMAFEQPELSPRELATRFTDTNGYYVSESSVYRLLKARDPIGSPAFIVIKAADEFKDETTAPNSSQGHRLGLVLPVHRSRRLLVLHPGLKAVHDYGGERCIGDVAVALQASGLDQVKVLHRPCLLSDNGPSYVSSELSEWLEDKGINTSAAELTTQSARLSPSRMIQQPPADSIKGYLISKGQVC
jgi:hypothetical protein